ncbi:MAG: hypothetical protein JO322_04445 [Candidatus Eremiobacteraeota bacterium]|nr:hypothetical protein [Candidatus Eremiobacteraeota bacterium]
MKNVLPALLLLAAVTACSQSTQSQSSQSQSSTAESPSPAATNPTGFPLYAESTVLASKAWSQNTGSQHYSGLEVVAQTPATMSQLNTWLKSVSDNPPSGYSVAASGSGLEEAHARARAMGVDFQVFQHTVNGKRHGLIVAAVDPTLFDEKAGPVLNALNQYKKLPQVFRDPIDAQARARTGFTVSDALEPNTPIGAAVEAVNELRSSGERGVVLVDGTRQ